MHHNLGNSSWLLHWFSSWLDFKETPLTKAENWYTDGSPLTGPRRCSHVRHSVVSDSQHPFGPISWAHCIHSGCLLARETPLTCWLDSRFTFRVGPQYQDCMQTNRLSNCENQSALAPSDTILFKVASPTEIQNHSSDKMEDCQRQWVNQLRC